MKKIIALVSCLLMLTLTITCMPLSAQAVDSPFLAGSFKELKQEEQEKAVKDLVTQISKELKLIKIPSCDFYVDASWPEAATNTALPDTSRQQDRISFNMGVILSSPEQKELGYSLEEYVVYITAHECRHSYQAQHAHDDTDYGKSCLEAFNADTAFYKNSSSSSNFIEQDASDWAQEYVTGYFQDVTSGSAQADDFAPVITKTTKTPFKNNIWTTLPSDKQQEAIEGLVQLIATELAIEAPEIEWEDQALTLAARYSSTNNVIIINSAAQLSGEELVYFIAHEMRHAYQYAHINDDTEFASIMRNNDANYISIDKDFDAYLSQPMEADAISYSSDFLSDHKNAAAIQIPITYETIETKSKGADEAVPKSNITAEGMVLGDMVDTHAAEQARLKAEQEQALQDQIAAQALIQETAQQIINLTEDTLAGPAQILSEPTPQSASTKTLRAVSTPRKIVTIGCTVAIILIICAAVLLVLTAKGFGHNIKKSHISFNYKDIQRRMVAMNKPMAGTIGQCIMITSGPSKSQLVCDRKYLHNF